ncbi:type VI secretion system protein TssL, long form [Sediminicurvatus halobius]|uniref:Type VI secretion system protein TssL n=1 Tax=Sediminicurvatus halobius TaxID=2182432 RepID=A0A2U2N3Y8_9GAMM|nr:type VI secretion system protein TssL, long form [Spiribacter halobius]PWG63945.1 type VI secretion system protein TssL [Spiribacter halobius]UEX76360.1 type VI secretion system protein TssL, long form [Spiribacter halobius]
MLGDPRNRKKTRIVPAGSPAWMATFADLSTLLLSFFVLLLSFSEMDVERYKQIAGSLRNAFGVQTEQFSREPPKGTSFIMRNFSPSPGDPSPINPMQQSPTRELRQGAQGDGDSAEGRESGVADMDAEAVAEAAENLEAIQALLAEEIERGLVEVFRNGNRVVIRIRERGSFPSGSAELIEPFAPVINKIGQALSMTGGDIIVAGHTDSVPISNSRFRSNWELSAARAVTLVHRLRDAGDVDERRFTVEGNGDTEPLMSNDSPLGRAINRRVEITLVHGEEDAGVRSAADFLAPREEGSTNDDT